MDQSGPRLIFLTTIIYSLPPARVEIPEAEAKAHQLQALPFQVRLDGSHLLASCHIRLIPIPLNRKCMMKMLPSLYLSLFALSVEAAAKDVQRDSSASPWPFTSFWEALSGFRQQDQFSGQSSFRGRGSSRGRGSPRRQGPTSFRDRGFLNNQDSFFDNQDDQDQGRRPSFGLNQDQGRFSPRPKDDDQDDQDPSSERSNDEQDDQAAPPSKGKSTSNNKGSSEDKVSSSQGLPKASTTSNASDAQKTSTGKMPQFNLRDPRFTAHKPAQPHESMNSLANHDFLPHSGRNLTLSKVVSGCFEGFGASPEVCGLITIAGLLNANLGLKDAFDLEDISRPSWMIEHDSSLTRKDASQEPNVSKFDAEAWAVSLKVLGKAEAVSAIQLGKAKAARIRDNKKKNKDSIYDSRTAARSVTEIALLTSVLGNIDGWARTPHIRTLFEREMLPWELGWRPRLHNADLPSILGIAALTLTAEPEILSMASGGDVFTPDDIIKATSKGSKDSTAELLSVARDLGLSNGPFEALLERLGTWLQGFRGHGRGGGGAEAVDCGLEAGLTLAAECGDESSMLKTTMKYMHTWLHSIISGIPNEEQSIKTGRIQRSRADIITQLFPILICFISRSRDWLSMSYDATTQHCRATIYIIVVITLLLRLHRLGLTEPTRENYLFLLHRRDDFALQI
ncbi:hypothetical protein L249_3045 [Ophiocordyceps polyrhachis-furcata BCC 54312]|uniref:Heme haloperoxidase family profile domain-containing protein n=1 Tax=Ophiocordyceps polyrhachis-furcata BCC 54312 TaxID=1330021 RepID=A0A367LNN7_9HYPO|nr:hypothetical protein L249_3045 [Ophiocordyceps polyrhachis-furcata BCC 54312]